MSPTPRRRGSAAPKSAIPQLSWRAPQPAPVVLVSGPEDVCAERAIAGVRDYLARPLGGTSFAPLPSAEPPIYVKVDRVCPSPRHSSSPPPRDRSFVHHEVRSRRDESAFVPPRASFASRARDAVTRRRESRSFVRSLIEFSIAMTIRRRVARCDDDIDRRVARDVWERVAVFARSGARARRRGGARGRDARAVGASSPGAGAPRKEIERLTDRTVCACVSCS